jgi:hypothetical protein
MIGVAPTILDPAGLPEPLFVNGVQQRPIEGVSTAYSFDDADAPERHETQYFEMFGNRGIYHKGWTAVTRHRTPWEFALAELPAFDDDVWQLYDTTTDWSQANDLAAEMPQKAARAAAPVADRGRQVQRPAAGRPRRRARQPSHGRPAPTRERKPAAAVRRDGTPYRRLGRQHQEQVARRDRGDRGARVGRGRRDHRPRITGGWSLYAKDGKPKYAYNFFGNTYTVEGTNEIPPGKLTSC